MSDNPIALFRDRLSAAEAAGVVMPIAMSLATADANGNPSVRMVILRGVDERGFVFYTNERSRKGRELEHRPRAALAFWWPQVEEQVRVEGRVRLLPAVEADAYFAGRPRGSQLGAWASPQSEVMASREQLQQAVDAVEREFAERDVPRPPFWPGYLVIPDTIEFWRGQPDRLHQRVLYRRDGSHWDIQLLYP